MATKATITSTEWFTDETSPTITYSNPSGTAATLYAAIYDEKGTTSLVPYRKIDNTKTSYTFNFTQSELNSLYQAVTSGNSIMVRFYLKTVIDGVEYGSFSRNSFTIMNANPVITASVVDVNETTKALVGDNGKTLVKYFSRAQATMEVEAQKGATIDMDMCLIKYRETIFGTSGTFDYVEGDTWTFSAADNRGNATSLPLTVDMVDYIKPTCNIADNRPDGDGNVTVFCSGVFFNGSFGAVTNELTAQYRYAVYGETYSDWADMTVTTDGNYYYASASLTGLDYQELYSFETRATDKLTTVSSAESVVSSIPMFHWSKNDFVFEVPVTFNAGVGSGDIVVEQGESNGWTYRKWSSGWAECWKTFQTTVIASDWASWGTLYTAPLVMNAALPFTFVSNKREFATMRGTANGLLIGGAWFLSQTTTGEYYVCSPTSYSGSYSYLTDICVVGMLE